jgi:hypothetical protein
MTEVNFDELIKKFNKNKKDLPKRYKYKFEINRKKNDYLSLDIKYLKKNTTVFGLNFTIDNLTNNHRIIESPVYFEIINKQKHYFPGDGKQHNFNLKNYEKFFINFIYLSIKFAWEDL